MTKTRTAIGPPVQSDTPFAQHAQTNEISLDDLKDMMGKEYESVYR